MEIEESGGRRKFCVAAEGRFREYEKRMLCGSDCPYVLPMHFIAEGETEKAYYDFTGYLQIAEHIRRQTSDADAAAVTGNQKLLPGALKNLTELLECLKGMELYLIFPERISIHPDLIFIDSNSGKAALAFCPGENPEAPLQNRIMDFLDDMSSIYRDAEVERYFQKTKEFIRGKNPGLDGMLAFLGTMQREVSCIYWHSADFRKEEGEDTSFEHERTDEMPEKGLRMAIMRYMRK